MGLDLCLFGWTALALSAMGQAAPVSPVDTIPPPPDSVVLAEVRPILLDTIPLQTSLDTITPIEIREMVVDVLRSPIMLDSAPFAVSVLTEDLWTTGRSQGSIEEALQGLPGVQIHNRFNDAVGERVSIRGYGSRSEFGVRGITILVDGIPATMPDGQATLDHLDLGSLGRVEALRGPGSALYGNASGGVLRFETRPPADVRIRQEVRFIEGDHDYRRRQATTSGHLGDVGYFLNVGRYEFGGYRVDPLATGEGPASSVYGSAERDHLNAQVAGPALGGRLFFIGNVMRLDAEDPGALSRQALAEGDRRALALNVVQHAGKQANQTQGGVRWEGPVGDRELEVMTYGIHHKMTNPLVASWVELDRVVRGFRASLRSEHVGEEGRLWWAIGVDGDLQTDHRRQFENQGGQRGLRTLDQQERVSGGAVFLQALLPINRVLEVLTGLRYDRIRFSATDRLPIEEGRPDATGTRTLDSASPSFGFHASFHDALGLYVNLSTAFETPTTSELANHPEGTRGFNPDLEPQVGITSEVGGRGIFAPILAWEAVFFHTTLYNELVAFEVPEQPGRRFFRNAGRSQRRGWEVALQFAPDPNIRARAVLSTNDARFRSFQLPGDASETDPGEGDGDPPVLDFRGNRVPGLAPRKLEGILRVGPGRWFVEVRGEATAAIPGNNANDRAAESPPYRLVDFRAGANEVNVLGLRLSPFLGVTNLMDEQYNTSVVVNAEAGRHFEPGPGRAFYMGASMAVEF